LLHGGVSYNFWGKIPQKKEEKMFKIFAVVMTAIAVIVAITAIVEGFKKVFHKKK